MQLQAPKDSQFVCACLDAKESFCVAVVASLCVLNNPQNKAYLIERINNQCAKKGIRKKQISKKIEKRQNL